MSVPTKERQLSPAQPLYPPPMATQLTQTEEVSLPVAEQNDNNNVQGNYAASASAVKESPKWWVNLIFHSVF